MKPGRGGIQPYQTIALGKCSLHFEGKSKLKSDLCFRKLTGRRLWLKLLSRWLNKRGLIGECDYWTKDPHVQGGGAGHVYDTPT
jgi:hypothetical protein